MSFVQPSYFSLTKSAAPPRADADFLQRALRIGQVAAWEWDLNTGSMTWSDNADELLGLSSAPTAEFDKRMHPEDWHIHEAALRTSLERGLPYATELRFIKHDGTIVWLEGRAELREGIHGQRWLTGVMRDITARKQAEAELNSSEARYRLLAEYATDMIVEASLDTTRRYVSPASRELLGYDPAELIGTKPLDAVHPEDVDAYREILDELTTGRSELAVSRQRYRRKDGGWVWTEATFRLVRDVGGRITGYVASVRDISERRQLEEQLRELARTDSLTGLANRRGFEERLEEEWRRALRKGSSFALILLDVDHFKQFNDEFGHSAGDDCLKQVATTLSRCRRMSDFPARVGGEEFALLLPETDSEGALVVAETVRQQVEAAGILHPRSPHAVVTASIGVAAFQPQPNRTASDVVRASDQAMYVAKRAGRNRVVSAAYDTGAELCQGNDLVTRDA